MCAPSCRTGPGCGTRAALPVVVQEGAPLAFRHWAPETPLEPDRYGIPTPMAGEWLIPDLILLPLNGFDGEGYRLGYGGGDFDRTLAALTPRPLAVGVGFEINRLPKHPAGKPRSAAGLAGDRGWCGQGRRGLKKTFHRKGAKAQRFAKKGKNCFGCFLKPWWWAVR